MTNGVTLRKAEGATYRVSTGGARHLSSLAAHVELGEALGVCEVSAACAATVASWWQSPGAVGSTLAALSSGQAVALSDLLDDIAATRPETTTAIERQYLDQLATWAIRAAHDGEA